MQLASVALNELVHTDYWAKVLPIPLANALVPWLERRGSALDSRAVAILARFKSLAWMKSASAAGIALWALIYVGHLVSVKHVWFDPARQAAWQTPLLCPGPDGAIDCSSNPAFCDPFRFDLEIASWARPRDHRCTAGQ